MPMVAANCSKLERSLVAPRCSRSRHIHEMSLSAVFQVIESHVVLPTADTDLRRHRDSTVSAAKNADTDTTRSRETFAWDSACTPSLAIDCSAGWTRCGIVH